MNEHKPTRAELLQIIERLVAENSRLRAEVEQLSQRVEELERERTQREPAAERPPAWIKPNKPPRTTEKRPRKKRAVGFARKRSTTPTVVKELAMERCPDCDCVLRGGTVKRHREVIEVVLPPPVITDYRLLERVCPRCDKSWVPTLKETDGVVGRHRFGPNLLALMATLHEEGRMPVERIQSHLDTVFQVQVSVGAIIDALRTVATRGAAQVTAIQREIQQSGVVHADETGWREDGQNCYVWLIATPTARYFEIGRRTNDTIDHILGKDFRGTLVTDFYAAYNHFLGEKQRCWAHLLRDVRDLLAQYPDDLVLARWARQLRRLYRTARASPDTESLPTLTPAARLAKRKRLEVLTTRLCEPFVEGGPEGVPPQAALCRRILKHLSELFTFVVNPMVPPTNNEAERALRPIVTGRKVSGGTRSAQGSKDAMRRATLFQTWRARGRNPFTEVRNLLLSPLL